jgi:hypothetical protein
MKRLERGSLRHGVPGLDPERDRIELEKDDRRLHR